MLALGPIGFAAPLALAGLIALPVIWWLLRVTPPAPHRVRFPALRLLSGLHDEEETPAATPWWLMALRLLAATLLILAFAEPVANPARQDAGTGPLLLVVDDGWASAPGWSRRQATLDGILATARRAGRDVALLTTTPRAVATGLDVLTADDATARATALTPSALAPDYAATATRLTEAALPDQGSWQVIWLSDGLSGDNADAFAEDLARHGPVTLIAPSADETALALLPPAQLGQSMEVTVLRATGSGTRNGTVAAIGKPGRQLTEAPFTIAEGETETTITLDMPLELRNAVTRLEISGENSAGAVTLLDDRWQRRTVGLVAGTSTEDAQPLLSDLYYLRRAVGPFAEIREAHAGSDTSEIEDLLSRPLSMLITADVGQLVGDDAERVRQWVEDGGTLVRFAGPRLAAQTDELMPVPLRGGGRALGGALTWATPQGLAPFEEKSPFAGLAIPEDVQVHRQVLADPTADLSSHTWARLTDGTPLVTATRRGDGWLVLFHVSADTDWSNLPISGLYVEMLRRVLDLSRGTGAGEQDAQRLLQPYRALDGNGRLVAPPALAEPLTLLAVADTRPGPTHPPGLYGTSDGFRALNVMDGSARLAPLETGFAASTEAYAGSSETALKPALLTLALLLLLADGVIALILSGRLRLPPALMARLRSGTTAAALTALLALPVAVMAMGTTPAKAQTTSAEDEIALLATLDTRLAYVITGNSRVDEMSRAGLSGLSQVLRSRTAIEPADPLGVDVERDELAFYPLLYWPVLPEQKDLSPEALARVDNYMKRGGTILFDTMDHQRIEAIGASPGNEALRRLLGNLDVPPLEPVSEGHVLTKAFYLLQTFPGRWAGGDLWVQAQGDADETPGTLNQDGVTPLLIGANDYAAAWAVDARGLPMAKPVPGGERQREMARRFGVNLVMYALTGNYKADQVHVPALLERLGQ
ncbi:DUF4159 domain-containing protein [Pyruvatibacter mobilis]|uniref:DUF4159 domain-containing protein n=1 Tax=Pyruvatibacter mobilis TaxID=1712261 RepID=UPI003C7C0D0B